MDISSRACAFIRRYLRAFQFSAKPPLSLVHRSIISSQALADSVACFIWMSIEFHPYLTFLVRLPTSYRPLSAMPHFCKYFATRYPFGFRLIVESAMRSDPRISTDLSCLPRFFIRKSDVFLVSFTLMCVYVCV